MPFMQAEIRLLMDTFAFHGNLIQTIIARKSRMYLVIAKWRCYACNVCLIYGGSLPISMRQSTLS